GNVRQGQRGDPEPCGRDGAPGTLPIFDGVAPLLPSESRDEPGHLRPGRIWCDPTPSPSSGLAATNSASNAVGGAPRHVLVAGNHEPCPRTPLRSDSTRNSWLAATVWR